MPDSHGAVPLPARAGSRADVEPTEHDSLLLILNRDLTAAAIPSVRAANLDLPESDGGLGGHPASWAMIWNFALTFEVRAYEEGTGRPLDGEVARRRVREAMANGSMQQFHLRDTPSVPDDLLSGPPESRNRTLRNRRYSTATRS